MERYGSYELTKKIATGGMAELFLARNVDAVDPHKLLVIKRIFPHLAENPDFVTMFLDEARIAARLNHPNVVQIYDLGVRDESYFIAMEYLHGEDVRRVWKRANAEGIVFPLEFACRIAIEAAQGLDYAHKKVDTSGRPMQIVHRDVAPQNVLVSFEGQVKVLDFGLAKAATQASTTRSGVLKGRYAYMSPEQASRQPVDHRTDQFALAVVLHELLAGQRLFKRSTDLDTLKAVTAAKVAPPSVRNPQVPKSLDAIVMRALSADREARYPDCGAFAAALDSWLHGHGQPVSQALLAAFMKRIYAQRLAREAAGEKVGELSTDASGPISAELLATMTRPAISTSAVDSEAETKPGRSVPVSSLQTQPPTSSAKARRRWLPLALVCGTAALAGLGWLVWPVAAAVVTVTSEPAGARVRFEGNALPCETPCVLPARPEGTYAIELSKPGYERFVAAVPVPETGALTVPLTLQASTPAAVEIVVNSLPNAAHVRLDDGREGATPFRFISPHGKPVSLRVELEGYLPVTDSFRADDTPRTYALTPVPQTPRPPAPKKGTRRP